LFAANSIAILISSLPFIIFFKIIKQNVWLNGQNFLVCFCSSVPEILTITREDFLPLKATDRCYPIHPYLIHHR
jgi:hypothetical protein